VRAVRTGLAATLAAAVLVVGLVAAGALWAAPGDVEVGATRATFAKAGTRLRSTPNPLGEVRATLAYGTLVRVTQVRRPWIEVTVVQGEGGSGWLRQADVVEAAVLTQGGQRGLRAGGPGPTGAVSAQDVSAAGRQLDASTEQGYRRAHPDLERFYPMVDAIEEANRGIDPAEVDEFITKGRLGRPGR
jgi:hypothetical protein